jgi:hypothetical protein
MLASSSLEPRCCRKSLPIRLRRPVITCFLGLESRNLNDLVLISFFLARETRAGGRSKRGGRANWTAACDNLYLNLAADSLQVQQTVIDDSIHDCS